MDKYVVTEINGYKLFFLTANNSFSPHRVDKGTLAMISCVELGSATPPVESPPGAIQLGESLSPGSEKILDLGCGYGVIGIYYAKLIGERNVVMSDIDAVSVELAKENAKLNGVPGIKVIQSDGFKEMDDKNFSLILSNPPYQADFAIPKHFIEKGFNRLRVGGRMMMVTKRELWYKNKLIAIFGGVRITEVDGYYVFCAEKRGTQYANAKRNTPTRNVKPLVSYDFEQNPP